MDLNLNWDFFGNRMHVVSFFFCGVEVLDLNSEVNKIVN